MANNKQRLDYIPQIDYTEDYYSNYNPPASVQASNVPTSSSLEQSINKIDTLIEGLPAELANAIKDIYVPVVDMLYVPYLKDKVIPDRTVQKEIIVNLNNSKPEPPKPDEPSGSPDTEPEPKPPGGGGDKPDDKPVVPSIINVQSIYLDNRSIFINVGQYRKLTATIVPSNATDKRIIWSSDDESIATVDENGNVYGVSLGKCCVYARSGNGRKYAKCRVRVLRNGGTSIDPDTPPEPPTPEENEVHVLRVEVEPKYHAMYKHKKVQLNATIYPDNASNKEVIWYSSDDSICSVDENGVVNSHNETGQCKIYVESTDTHKKAICYMHILEDDEPIDGDGEPDGSHPGGGGGGGSYPNPNPPGTNPDDDEPTDDNPDGSDPGDEGGLWETDDLPSFEFEENDIRDVTENEFTRNISDLLVYYFDNLIKQITGYYYANVSSITGLKGDDLKRFLSDVQDLSVKLDSQHLKDLALRQEKLSNIKLNFFENSFNVHQTTRHIQAFLVSYGLRKRYLNIQFNNSGTSANSLSNTVLKSARQSYDKQYEDTYIDLFKYLNSSIKISNDLFDDIVKGYKMKELIVKKGGTR